jgi:hypothetical protein
MSLALKGSAVRSRCMTRMQCPEAYCAITSKAVSGNYSSQTPPASVTSVSAQFATTSGRATRVIKSRRNAGTLLLYAK